MTSNQGNGREKAISFFYLLTISTLDNIIKIGSIDTRYLTNGIW